VPPLPDDEDEPRDVRSPLEIPEVPVISYQVFQRKSDRKFPTTVPHTFTLGGLKITIKSFVVSTDHGYAGQANSPHIDVYMSLDEVEGKEKRFGGYPGYARIAEVLPKPPDLSTGCSDARKNTLGTCEHFDKREHKEIKMSYQFIVKNKAYAPSQLWLLDGGIVDLK
jgi:hypothetical protein